MEQQLKHVTGNGADSATDKFYLLHKVEVGSPWAPANICPVCMCTTELLRVLLFVGGAELSACAVLRTYASFH